VKYAAKRKIVWTGVGRLLVLVPHTELGLPVVIQGEK
jgi:hypothetical protein